METCPIHHLAVDADYLIEMPERVQVLQLTSRHWSSDATG